MALPYVCIMDWAIRAGRNEDRMMSSFGRLVLAAGLASFAVGCDAAADDAAAGGAATVKPMAASAPAGGGKPQNKPWTEVVAMTPEGGIRMGNPNAKVKLIEFASLTCPHCKDFHEAATATLKSKYVASGNVSYEFRNFVLNGPDYAASLLARCQGAGPFFGLLNAFYTDQASWVEPFTKLSADDQKRLQALPQDQQIAGLAMAGKLDAYVRTRGIPKARFDACLSDAAALKVLADMRTQATDTYKLTGTPGFIINGKTQAETFDWKTLEPKLQAALN
jgi:protein-disulfide isomerase